MSANGFKTQLKEALSSAVGYFQDSGDPNAACVKAANEAGFNPDQADRLVETFNTARVICHYKAAEDKASSCSLADKATVRGQLEVSGTDDKTAEYDRDDYGCYKQAEVDYVVPAVKEAEFTVHEEPLSKEAQDWLDIRERNTVMELMKEAEEQARGLHAMADELAEKIAMQLSRNVSLSDVHDKMARIVRAYALDDRYAPGVEKVAAFLPSASDPDISVLTKYAKQHIVDTSDLKDIVAAIKEASDFVAEASAFEAYAGEMRKYAQAAPAADNLDQASVPDLQRMLLIERVRGERNRNTTGGQQRGGSGSGGSRGAGSSSALDAASGALTPFIVPLIQSGKSRLDAEREDRINKATDGINNIRRQLILQDLLTTDKVLSQEDPSRVAAAFRSVNQISPDSTLNKEVLRSMLRSVVQSVAISPFDAKTLADLDKSRRQAYEPKANAKGDAK